MEPKTDIMMITNPSNWKFWVRLKHNMWLTSAGLSYLTRTYYNHRHLKLYSLLKKLPHIICQHKNLQWKWDKEINAKQFRYIHSIQEQRN